MSQSPRSLRLFALVVVSAPLSFFACQDLSLNVLEGPDGAASTPEATPPATPAPPATPGTGTAPQGSGASCDPLGIDEREPNDELATATPLTVDVLCGTVSGPDVDFIVVPLARLEAGAPVLDVEGIAGDAGSSVELTASGNTSSGQVSGNAGQAVSFPGPFVSDAVVRLATMDGGTTSYRVRLRR